MMREALLGEMSASKCSTVGPFKAWYVYICFANIFNPVDHVIHPPKNSVLNNILYELL